MKKKYFSLNDVQVVSDHEILPENALSDIIGGFSSSYFGSCDSCNCWFDNQNKEQPTEDSGPDDLD